MPVGERGRLTRSLLKPSGGYGARHVDAAAEAVGLAHLERLAGAVGVDIELLIDGDSHRIGRAGSAARICAAMDVIDGTVKVAGLGPPEPDRVRLANDGAWAAAFALPLPTMTPPRGLLLGDFTVTAMVDGHSNR